MPAFVTYRGFAIEWIDYMECYRVYDLRYPQWTCAYTDSTIEEIKRSIDHQFFKEA